MPRRTTPPAGGRIAPQPEPEDSYPHIPEPKQAHGGTLLAIVSVFAILGFGVWTAVGTLTAPANTTTGKPQTQTTIVPTKPAVAAAPTSAAASTPAGATTTASAPPASTPAAQAGASTPGPGGTRVHVVGQGDTLYRIAALYGTTVDAIMAANGFTDRSKVLHVGDKLKIP